MGKVKQMILSFHPCFTAGHQMILGDRGLASKDHRLIQRAEAIILPQTCSHDLYDACKRSSAELFPNYEMKFKYPGKLGQSLLFEEFHFRHPVTMRWASVDDFRSFMRKGGVLSHDLPFFIKANESHEGTGVFVITGPQTLEDVLEKLSRWEQTGQWGFVSQELIPCEGNVLRSVILGKQIITYWKRPEKPGQLVTSVSRNALVDKTWKKALQKKGQLRAKGFSEVTGINLAAIDFLFSFTDPEPEPLFLEINYYFGRRGLGGSLNYYRLLHKAILEWLSERGFDPDPLQLL